MFVQVILPLRLAWLPAYKADGQDLHVGDRVRVRFAGREYVGVVSQLDVTPDIEARRIQPVLGVEDQLPAVLPSELAFWQFISEYYLCSIGEVYKYVYPASRNRTEEKKARRALAETVLPGPSRLDAAGKRAAAAVLAAFDEERPVLLQTARSERIESELVRRCLESGRDVLVIEPDAARESYVTLPSHEIGCLIVKQNGQFYTSSLWNFHIFYFYSIIVCKRIACECKQCEE